MILSAFLDNSDPAPLNAKVWATDYRYDPNDGVLVQTAMPSAVTITNQAGLSYAQSNYADVVGYSMTSGTYQYIASNAGVVYRSDYGQSTSATSTSAGDVSGYLKDDYVQQGSAGTPITLDTTKYISHTDSNSVTIYPVATSTAYRYTNATGAEVTSYSYSWFQNGASTTNQMLSETESDPVISAGQDGPGVADVTMTYYDAYGRANWTMDPDGFIDYMVHDNATGAQVEEIDDVNTALTGEFTGLPAPGGISWATPSGGGLNLITYDAVDGLGRTIEELSPAGRITWWTYDDPDHEVRTYPGWDPTAGTTTGPTEVTRIDYAGNYTETLTMSAAPATTGTAGHLAPTGAEAIGNVQSLTRDLADNTGRTVEEDRYFSLANVTDTSSSSQRTIGSVGANYYATSQGYDLMGRPSRVVDAVGTITDTTYDGLGRVASVAVGTSDSYAPGPTTPSNMVTISVNQYDGNGVGDGDLTQTTSYPDAVAADARVTQYAYDFRDRLVATKSGVQSSEDTSTHRPIVYDTLDNLGEVTSVSQYDGDTVTLASFYPTVMTTPATFASLLRNYATTSYDDQGRVYSQQRYEVTQSGGSSGAISTSALTTNTYYDHRGDVIATYAPGGLVTKDQFDGVGRLTLESQTDGAGGSSWTNAGSIANDHVFSQSLTAYDKDGNATLVTTKDRFHDDSATGTGTLGGPSSGLLARVSYVADYYDNADRLVAEADAGTDGGSAYSPPTTAPASSDTLLVTAYAYSPGGWVATVTDPRGVVTQTSYDLAGRAVTVIDNYDSSNGGVPTDSTNQTTVTRYDGLDHARSVTAVLKPGAASQATTYVYGTTVSGGSSINDNDLLSKVIQPGSSPAPANSASFVGTDTTTQGTWHGTAYGNDGNLIANTAPGLPSYVTASVSEAGSYPPGSSPGVGNYASPGVAPNDLQTPTSTTVRLGSAWFGTTITFDVNLTDGKAHQVAFYARDWSGGRSETVQVLDASTNAVLDTENLSSFGGGTYLDWNLQGHVKILVTSTNAGNNAVASGLFFSAAAASATLLTRDATTQGTWHGTAYGNDGNLIANSTAGLPAYATVSVASTGAGNYQSPSSDTRDLQTPSSFTARAGTAWYGPTVTFDVNLTDGKAHQVAIYARDWSSNHSEVVQILDASTNAVLDTENLASFANGVYLDWNLQGHVKIVVTSTNGNDAVVSGIFFSPASNDADSYTYDALGDVVTHVDPAGTAHAYAFDVLGRQVSDSVTALGPGVDGSVRRIATAYDTADRPYLHTSYDSATGGNVVNQVMDLYNGLDQLVGEYQEHAGAVVTSSTPEVRYAYTEMAGSQDNSRPVSMTYPNGRVIDYVYNSSGTGSTALDSSISRLSSIADDSSGSPGTTLESYLYLGLDTPVEWDHPQTGINLTYIRQGGTTPGDGGDQYIGLDRFGRVVDQDWASTGAAAQPERYQYGYDRDGDVLYRSDLVNTALSELYHASSSTSGDNNTAYDKLGRLGGFLRGTLAASGNNGTGLDSVSSSSRSQSWSLDALGNWTSATTVAAGTSTSTSKTFNSQNQTTSVSAGTAPAYDAAGSTVTDAGQAFTYDAWHRLVAVRSVATGSVVASYAYDALGERISETYPGTPTVVNHLYYSSGSQVIEERQGGTGSSNLSYQYVWGATGALVLRDAYTGGASSRLYALQDANGDVTALVNASGVVQERYEYDPYGAVTVLNAGGSPVAGNTSAFNWRYLYQAGRLDNSTGLYTFGARDYLPAEGRWMQRDPLGLGAGDLNEYRFVGDNPSVNNDPTGLTDFVLGGQPYVWPWNQNANWNPVSNSNLYINTFVVTAAGTAGGAAGGGITGARSWGAVGALVGAPAGPAGSLAGLLAGGELGLDEGALFGGLVGGWQSLTNTPTGGSFGSNFWNALSNGFDTGWEVGPYGPFAGLVGQAKGLSQARPRGPSGNPSATPTVGKFPLSRSGKSCLKSPDSKPYSPSTPDGNYLYGQDPSGKIYIIPDVAGNSHPSILGGNQPLIGAGEMKIQGGKITQLTNTSGNFRFPTSSLSGVSNSIVNGGGTISPGGIQPWTGGY